MADQDLQIRRGPGHPDPEIREGGGGRGRAVLNFFSALWASVWAKIKKGGGGPSLYPPLQYRRKVLLSSFHLNVHSLECYTQKLEPP